MLCEVENDLFFDALSFESLLGRSMLSARMHWVCSRGCVCVNICFHLVFVYVRVLWVGETVFAFC